MNDTKIMVQRLLDAESARDAAYVEAYRAIHGHAPYRALSVKDIPPHFRDDADASLHWLMVVRLKLCKEAEYASMTFEEIDRRNEVRNEQHRHFIETMMEQSSSTQSGLTKKISDLEDQLKAAQSVKL